jgi:inorganic phosphate transporter, PiT family
VIAALLVATGHLQATGDELPIPLWVVLAAHTAIALGTISGGWRIVQTMGQRITELRPARGMAADGQMALAWVVTIPAAALAAAGVFALTQLGSHLLAGAALAVLGLAVALWIGLQRTTRSRHFEPDQLAAEDSPALVR